LVSINGVGPTVAWHLQCEGFETVADIARADADELASVHGIGVARANQLITEAAEMVELDDDDDDAGDEASDRTVVPDGREVAHVAIYADDGDFPDSIGTVEHRNEVGEDGYDDLVEAIKLIQEAIDDSPFKPTSVVFSNFASHAVAVRSWAIIHQNSDFDYSPKIRAIDFQWPTWDDFATNRDGERVRVRDDDGLTSEGWKMGFRATDAKLADVAKHAICVTEDEFEWTFTNEFEDNNPKGDVYRHYEDSIEADVASDAMGVDITEQDQTANKGHWDEAADELMPPSEDAWHRGPMDTVDSRDTDEFLDGDGVPKADEKEFTSR
jgi:hypothetical protein